MNPCAGGGDRVRYHVGPVASLRGGIRSCHPEQMDRAGVVEELRAVGFQPPAPHAFLCQEGGHSVDHLVRQDLGQLLARDGVSVGPQALNPSSAASPKVAPLHSRPDRRLLGLGCGWASPGGRSALFTGSLALRSYCPCPHEVVEVYEPDKSAVTVHHWQRHDPGLFHTVHGGRGELVRVCQPRSSRHDLSHGPLRPTLIVLDQAGEISRSDHAHNAYLSVHDRDRPTHLPRWGPPCPS